MQGHGLEYRRDQPPPAAQRIQAGLVNTQLERWPGQAKGKGCEPNSFELGSDVTRLTIWKILWQWVGRTKLEAHQEAGQAARDQGQVLKS